MIVAEDRFKKVLEGKASPLERALLADDVKDLDYPYVIKLDGTVAADPAAYILRKYGAAVSWRRAEVHPDGKYIYRLVGFAETSGTACLYAHCIDRVTQEPLVGKAAIRYWPGAERLPEILPPASAWTEIGVIAHVKADGRADWGVGGGDAYNPATQSGASKVWICTLDGPCDLFENWGWLAGTRYCHLAPIFERVEVDGEPPVDGVDLTGVIKALDRITAAIEKPRTIS